MTTPVQEPTPSRDLSGLGWGERQLARRPAIASQAAGTTAALLHEIQFQSAGDEDVAADTWELVTDGSGARSFLEGWRLDNGWTVLSGGDGNFRRNDFALYESWISMEFGGANDGDTIGAAVQYSASNQFFYPNLIVVAGGIDRVICCAHWWGTLSTAVRFWCYSNPGNAISRCELFCRRFELSDDGETLDYS